MLTIKQLLLGISLAAVSNVVSTIHVNALPDNGGTQITNGPPSFLNPPLTTRFSSTDSSGQIIVGSGLTEGITIPANMITSGVDNTSGDGITETASGAGSVAEAITIADIANYYSSNINESLQQLDSSSRAQSDKPQRIVRRRSSACPAACSVPTEGPLRITRRRVSTYSTIQPARELDTEELDLLLSESQKFIEQVNGIRDELNPEKNIW